MHTFSALLLVGSAILSSTSASCVHNTSLKPRAEDGSVPISNFGYTGVLGPFNWAGLDAENIACSTSSNQSPININSATNKVLTTAPQIDFPPVKSAVFENLGTTIEVIASGTTTIGGKAFSLKQFHFHTPSEHRYVVFFLSRPLRNLVKTAAGPVQDRADRDKKNTTYLCSLGV